MEHHRPLYFCLTDGSGGNSQPRIGSTTRLLTTLGATRGGIYGRYRDKELYRLLLDRNVEVFPTLANELADNLIEARIEVVAGDAMEGFNPGHDLCRALLDSAVAIVRSRTNRELTNYEFAVHDDPAAATHGATICLRLDDEALERKMAAAWAYTGLRDEVSEVLGRLGRDAFALECLRPPSSQAMLEQFERIAPEYEQVGSSRVAAGRYPEVVRYREHVLPVLNAVGIVRGDLVPAAHPTAKY